MLRGGVDMTWLCQYYINTCYLNLNPQLGVYHKWQIQLWLGFVDINYCYILSLVHNIFKVIHCLITVLQLSDRLVRHMDQENFTIYLLVLWGSSDAHSIDISKHICLYLLIMLPCLPLWKSRLCQYFPFLANLESHPMVANRK